MKTILGMRNVATADLAGYDAVLCAALSNDPLDNLNPAASYWVNRYG